MLEENSLREFFNQFLDKYREHAEGKNEKNNLVLLNSFPVKTELMLSNDGSYAVALLSKNASGIEVLKLQDPMMVVAMANSRKYALGAEGNFVYVFQVHGKNFQEWNPEEFAKFVIGSELAKIKK